LNKTIVILVSILLLGLFMVPTAPEAHAQDFSITVNPGTQTHRYGANVTYYIEVQSISGFSASVFLYASINPSKAGISVGPPDPGLVTPPKNGVAHSILQINIGNDPSYGVVYYQITVTASSSGLTRYGYASLTVTTTEDVSMYITPKSQMITPGGAPTYSLGISWAGVGTPSQSTFYVNLAMSGATAAFYGTYGYGTITYGPVTSYPPDYATLTITTLTSVIPGSYPLSIVASGATTREYYFILVIRAPGDFSISASPTSLSINQGDTANSTITVKSTSPFASPTSLTWSWVDTAPATGVTPSLSPTTVTPTSGGSKESKLTIATTSTATKGTFTIMVTGTCYQLSDNVNITLTIVSVADFTITASPTSRTVFPSQSADYTVTITPSGGFDKTIVLTLSPAPPTGISYAFQPPSVTPPTTVTSTLTVYTTLTVSATTYVLTIYGAGDGKSDTFQVTLIVSSKTDSAISLSLDKSSVKVGESVILSGSIRPNPGSGYAVTIEYSLDGSAWSTVTAVDTDSDGRYTHTWTPPSKGNYRFRSSWEGSIAYNGDTSGEATLTVETAAPAAFPLCIIATATYGSELSPEVQFLRSFRDQQVKSTFAGDQFMVAFNAWYYSFSPSVAQFIASNNFARAVMKALLYPLIGILHLAAMTYNAFSFSHELGVVMAGIIASALIGLVYFSPTAIALLALLKKHRKLTLGSRHLRILVATWLAVLGSVAFSEVLMLSVVVMISAAMLVLVTLLGVALFAANAVVRKLS